MAILKALYQIGRYTFTNITPIAVSFLVQPEEDAEYYITIEPYEMRVYDIKTTLYIQELETIRVQFNPMEFAGGYQLINNDMRNAILWSQEQKVHCLIKITVDYDESTPANNVLVGTLLISGSGQLFNYPEPIVGGIEPIIIDFIDFYDRLIANMVFVNTAAGKYKVAISGAYTSTFAKGMEVKLDCLNANLSPLVFVSLEDGGVDNTTGRLFKALHYEYDINGKGTGTEDFYMLLHGTLGD